MKSELEQLKKRLHKYIDAEISKVVKPEIEVGKWYKSESGMMCVFNSLAIENNQYVDGYGFVSRGDFWNNKIPIISTNMTSNLRLATESEIFEALKTECLKLFKVGDRIDRSRFDNFSDKKIITIDDLDLKYILYENILMNSGRVLFNKGKWATVIESKQTIETQSLRAITFTQPITPELLTKIKNLL